MVELASLELLIYFRSIYDYEVILVGSILKGKKSYKKGKISIADVCFNFPIS